MTCRHTEGGWGHSSGCLACLKDLAALVDSPVRQGPHGPTPRELATRLVDDKRRRGLAIDIADIEAIIIEALVAVHDLVNPMV